MKHDEKAGKTIPLVRSGGVECPSSDCRYWTFACWVGRKCRHRGSVDYLFGVAIVSYVALVSCLAWAWYETLR